ncbi:SirB1 family protein [Candidatus Korobacter versatilis]|uniref:SirB1 family protein n=1 Tax=Candidatus Korobacter versatilis TaxID=658062 RepID=UPI00165044B2|nr:transglutaminase-like domain-containing protein [Candidatus Koribacter versatilis]
MGTRSVTEEFIALVRAEIEDDRIDLLHASLTIARTEYPNLDIRNYVTRVEALASKVRSRLSPEASTIETVNTLNHVMFHEMNFRGNREDYYDPRNSFLNDVIERRLGIPITMSVLYMEVARRVGLPLVGVGMPGHFLLKVYDVEGRQILIDPFNNGSMLNASECEQRMKEIYAGEVRFKPEFLLPVSRRQILTRMLNNLRHIYMTVRQFRKTLAIVDLVVAIYPRSPEDVKQRAMLRFSVGQLAGSLRDLEQYLKMSPDGSDVDELKHMAMSIRKTMATWN